MAESLSDMRDGHERLEEQLAFDKTWMVARCEIMNQQLRKLRQTGDLSQLKQLLGNVKMTKAMQAIFIRNGLKNLESMFRRRKKGLFREVRQFGKYKEDLRRRMRGGVSRLRALFKGISKREKIKTFYQLKTGAMVSSKLSFLKKNLAGCLFTLFRKKKYQALRQIELHGLNERNQDNQKRTAEMSRRMRGIERSMQLANVLADILFKRRISEGNNLMVRLKDTSFSMRRVYRDKTEDDHGEVVRNTIKVANLVKHFRNKQLAVMFRYFQIWVEETFEIDDYSGEFEEGPVGSPMNPLYSSMDISKSPMGQGGFGRVPRFGPGDNQSFG